MQNKYSKKIAIIGASGHGKVVADIASLNGYNDIVFLDDDETITSCGDYFVVGNSKDAVSIGCDVFVAIGNEKVRKRILNELINKSVSIPTLVHPNAVVAEHVALGVGTVIMAGAVINPYSYIGNGAIINTCASIDHDCRIGDYVHVAVGAHVCGTVIIGDMSWIGAGSTVINNINICPNVVIGAGAVVVDSIQEAGIYLGMPARKR